MKHLELKKRPASPKGQHIIVVSSKVSKLATKRNLLKRRARHILRKNIGKFKANVALTIFFKPGATELSFNDLENEVENVLSQAKII